MNIWMKDITNKRHVHLTNRIHHLPRKTEKIIIDGTKYVVIEVTHDFSEDSIIIEVEEEKR